MKKIYKDYPIKDSNEITELADYIYFCIDKSIAYDKAGEIAKNLYSIGYRLIKENNKGEDNENSD